MHRYTYAYIRHTCISMDVYTCIHSITHVHTHIVKRLSMHSRIRVSESGLDIIKLGGGQCVTACLLTVIAWQKVLVSSSFNNSKPITNRFPHNLLSWWKRSYTPIGFMCNRCTWNQIVLKLRHPASNNKNGFNKMETRENIISSTLFPLVSILNPMLNCVDIASKSVGIMWTFSRRSLRNHFRKIASSPLFGPYLQRLFDNDLLTRFRSTWWRYFYWEVGLDFATIQYTTIFV